MHKHEFLPPLYDLLTAILDMQPLQDLLRHPYWSSPIGGDSATAIDMEKLAGNEMKALRPLQVVAFRSLPAASRAWLTEQGLSISVEERLE